MKNYIELCKPRITLLVAATAALGYFLAGGRVGTTIFWAVVIGVSLSSAAAGAWNQYLERDCDALMLRTAHRPLPARRIAAPNAAITAAFLGFAGLSILFFFAGIAPALLTALTLILYLGAYTPLKRVTPHSTWFGAAAGATPPLIGWAAATGGALPLRAWILFSIVSGSPKPKHSKNNRQIRQRG